jgi:membrane protease YdiL (CAAX protease family)
VHDPAPLAPTTRRAIWQEVLVLYVGSALVIRGIKSVVDSGGLSGDWLVLVALVFLYTPVLAEHWHRYQVDADILFPEGGRVALPWTGRNGLPATFTLPDLVPALKWLALLVVIIYPVFLIGYHHCQSWAFHWFSSEVMSLKVAYPKFTPGHGLPDDLWLQILYQLLCVGYAEEFFYRGYMQTRLDDLFRPDRFTLLGARFGWSLPVTAVLFTIGHSIVTLQWWQPFIIFPALLFGWLRARTGNILAGALFHAWANTVMIVLDHIYGITS